MHTASVWAVSRLQTIDSPQCHITRTVAVLYTLRTSEQCPGCRQLTAISVTSHVLYTLQSADRLCLERKLLITQHQTEVVSTDYFLFIWSPCKSNKPQSRAFDSRWFKWNFSFSKSFRLHYGPGVDSATNRNEYQEYLLGGKGGRCVGLTTLPPSCADCL